MIKMFEDKLGKFQIFIRKRKIDKSRKSQDDKIILELKILKRIIFLRKIEILVKMEYIYLEGYKICSYV